MEKKATTQKKKSLKGQKMRNLGLRTPRAALSFVIASVQSCSWHLVAVVTRPSTQWRTLHSSKQYKMSKICFCAPCVAPIFCSVLCFFSQPPIFTSMLKWRLVCAFYWWPWARHFFQTTVLAMLLCISMLPHDTVLISVPPPGALGGKGANGPAVSFSLLRLTFNISQVRYTYINEATSGGIRPWGLEGG